MSGLMLLDTPSLYFRAFYGVPESVTAPDGTPVNAVRGLIDMIARLVQDRSPERLVCTMDADWRPAFRVDALPSYKAHRVADDGGDQTLTRWRRSSRSSTRCWTRSAWRARASPGTRPTT
ncbi:hypothetical protein ACFQHO_43130 [Actinomadura yumaensis]|uniref:hypothetical protein n=1 Tax=Actinomadura yumaensis TaxID=111807 RepID=UPI003617A723